jgi:hypothetical protein
MLSFYVAYERKDTTNKVLKVIGNPAVCGTTGLFPFMILSHLF